MERNEKTRKREAPAGLAGMMTEAGARPKSVVALAQTARSKGLANVPALMTASATTVSTSANAAKAGGAAAARAGGDVAVRASVAPKRRDLTVADAARARKPESEVPAARL